MGITKFIETICVQTAVHWTNNGTDGFGKTSFALPVEIKCRWVEKDEMSVDDNGKEFVSKAEIIITQDIARTDYLYLGTLVDIASEADPKNVEGANEVKRFTKVPMIKSTTEFVRKAFL